MLCSLEIIWDFCVGFPHTHNFPQNLSTFHKHCTRDIFQHVAFAHILIDILSNNLIINSFNIDTYHYNNRREKQNFPLLTCTSQSLVSLCIVI